MDDPIFAEDAVKADSPKLILPDGESTLLAYRLPVLSGICSESGDVVSAFQWRSIVLIQYDFSVC